MESVKVFLISPVARATKEVNEKISAYIGGLERRGCKVHWPFRDTNQDDPTGGYEICKTNFKAILGADEIHIWYDESSGGSKFDMGGVFMLVKMLGVKKKIVIANDKEVVDNSKKSLYKIFKRLADKI